MPIALDRQRYFWLEGNGDATTGVTPEPRTYEASIVTPLIDLYEYMEKFRQALDLVGTDPDPSNNRGEFIFIAGWWLGLIGGSLDPNRLFEAPGSGLGSGGASIGDKVSFDLDPLLPERTLLDVLKQKAKAGVDVRVLGWVSFSLFATDWIPIPVFGTLLINPLLTNYIQRMNPGGLIALNGQTINSITNLRLEPALAKGGMLNMIGHSAGAVHVKGAIVGSKPDADGKSKAIAFTGGLDLEQSRWARYGHEFQTGWDTIQPSVPMWHDVQVAFEGPAAQGFYDHFKDMWNENLRREARQFNFEGKKCASYVPGMTAVPERIVNHFLTSPATPTTHHVQSLRTIPAFNYHWYNCLPENSSVSYAPNGLFEVKAAWKKAISGAQTYIYIEDQMYWGKEIFQWINEAVRNNLNLKVIIARSGSADPNDPPTPEDGQLLHESVNIGLLGIGTVNELTAVQRNQIRFFRFWGESTETSDKAPISSVVDISPTETEITLDMFLPPQAKPIPPNAFVAESTFVAQGPNSWAIKRSPKIDPGQPVKLIIDPGGSSPVTGIDISFKITFGLFVHSKITIIDDKWAIIGSANVGRRSLYTDWEHAIAFMDEAELAVADFRAKLWAEHFNLPEGSSGTMLNLQDALGSWDAAWATAGSTPMPTRAAGDLGPPYIQAIPIPYPTIPLTDKGREKRDAILDVDSRDDWGGICPPEKD